MPGEDGGRLRVIATPDEQSPIQAAMDEHPAGKGLDEKQRALLDAEKWANRVVIAREEYGNALVRCKRAGLSNSRIARAVGKTEAAVRIYLKRKGI